MAAMRAYSNRMSATDSFRTPVFTEEQQFLLARLLMDGKDHHKAPALDAARIDGGAEFSRFHLQVVGDVEQIFYGGLAGAGHGEERVVGTAAPCQKDHRYKRKSGLATHEGSSVLVNHL